MIHGIKFFLIIGLALSVLSTGGCVPKKEEAEPPQIKRVTKAALPRLIIPPSDITDKNSVQKTPDILPVAKPEKDPNEVFFIQTAPSYESPVEKGGARFDPAILLNGKTLTLRGVMVRKYEISALSLMNIYSGAFYIDQNVTLSETEDLPDAEKVLILEYHLDVPKEKVVQTIRDSVYSNPDVSPAEVEADFQKLSAAFDPPHKGYRYEFVSIPGRGMAMIRARKILTLITNPSFDKAFFDIWFSPKNADQETRCEFLGLPCAKKNNLNPVNLISSNLNGAKEKLGKLKKLIP